MSLPLTRRIARAALLVAAGAAPVVGAAGSASALDHSLAPAGGLPGLSALDTTAADSTLDTATGVVGETGGKAAPAAQQLASDPAGAAADTLGQTAGAAAESAEAPASDALGGLPDTGALPGAGLMGGLPIGG
ncbi:ATP-binding protein [Streptomyces sp. NPDC126499]|uniref:ATP-binding protein n=1 Tax=Streptomyces sp. NPDC126499 TaxID=3155314 RepID=UPI00331FE48F